MKALFLFLILSFIFSIGFFITSIFMRAYAPLVFLALALRVIVPGLALVSYIYFQRWSREYERDMGSNYPVLSARVRRIMIGEGIVVLGLIFEIFGISDGLSVLGVLGVLTTVGEIIVGINLIRVGKLFMMENLPQIELYQQQQSSPEPRYPKTKEEEIPEYRPPQRLIPEKAFFCPSCGAKLEAESLDFCMKCGKPIPKPEE
jgi:hypothetical protein